MMLRVGLFGLVRVVFLVCFALFVFAWGNVTVVEPTVPAPASASVPEAVPTPMPTPAAVPTPAPAPMPEPSSVRERRVPRRERGFIIQSVEEPPVAPQPVAGGVQLAEGAAIDSVPVSKPKIAVYVTGVLDPIEGRTFGTYILDALVKSERYIAIERTNEFLAQIDSEHIRQRSGAIDDGQISRLGKQSGVQFIAVADVTKAFGGNQVSVRMLDVETARIIAVGVTEGQLRTITELRDVASTVVDAMLNIVRPEERIRLGGRLAYNNSFVSGYAYTVRTYDRETFTRHEVERKNEFGKGSGFEVGGIIGVRIAGQMSVETGANLVWRNPVTIGDVVKMSEFAITIPALLRYNIGASPYYAQGGWQIELPFAAREKMSSEKAVEFKERSSADVGFILGGGRRFGKSLSADLRIIGGVISFDGQPNHHLFQAALGANLMF